MSSPSRVIIIEPHPENAQLSIRELKRETHQTMKAGIISPQSFLAAIFAGNWNEILDKKLACREELEVTGNSIANNSSDSDSDSCPLVIITAGQAADSVLNQCRSVASAWPADKSDSDQVQSKQYSDQDQLFRSIVEKVSDLIVIIDRKGLIQYYSPSIVRVLGFAGDELIGKLARDFVHSNQRHAAKRHFLRLRRAPNDSPQVNFRVQDKEGQWRHLEGTITNLLDDPIVNGMVCSFRDVTRRHAVQEQLTRAQRMESLGNLAGGIAHDLNNMLTPVLIGADLLREEHSARDREVLLQGMIAGAQRASDVVHHLLAFSKGMRSDQGIALVPKLVRETEQLLGFGFPKTISIHTNVPESIWPVEIGATDLVQVLMNLCVNARDAMPDGGRLRINVANVYVDTQSAKMHSTCCHPGRYVVLNVVDSGMGMPPEVRSRIFEPFFTTKGDLGGTGLGLSTTKRIVEEQGGFINVYAEPGKGSRFAVYIPAASADESTTTDETRDLPKGNNELVLVIDDEASIREVIKETLEFHNFQVVTAADGAVGLVLYRDHAEEIDLIIVDLSTPVMDGPATIAGIRRINPEARIILQSGWASRRSEALITSHAANAFLEKPYTTNELLHCVHDLIHR